MSADKASVSEKLRASSVTPIERIQHTLSVLCMDATPEVRAELSDLIEDVGNLVPSRETLLRDLREIEQLIDEHGNANFACGEWTPENDDEEYDAVSDRANFARKQLVDLISARIMNPSAGRAPSPEERCPWCHEAPDSPKAGRCVDPCHRNTRTTTARAPRAGELRALHELLGHVHDELKGAENDLGDAYIIARCYLDEATQ